MPWHTALLVAVTVAATALLARPAPVLAAMGSLRIEGHAHVAELDAYGPRGTTVLGYVHDREITVVLPLRNDGRHSVEVLAVDPFPEVLGMLTVDRVVGPLRLDPGERVYVAMQARFTNCEFYTERAVNNFTAAMVTVAAFGTPRTIHVAYPTDVVVRSPTIVGCPDRVTDRSARQRQLADDEG